MIRYKIDVMKELKLRGYSSAKLRNDKIMGEKTMTYLRHGDPVDLKTINTICLLLRKQPGDIIEVIPTDEEKIKYF